MQDVRTKKITQLTDLDFKQSRTHRQDQYPMWGADGMLYFASERDDTFNIWRIAPAGGAPVQVTRDKGDGLQFPSISPDGKTIVYESGFDLWTLDVPGGSPKKVTIDMAFDPKDNLISFVQTKNKADGFAPSPDGDYLAVDHHGEIFIVPTDPEVGEKTQVTSSSWRDQEARFSPDGRYVAYISDESKEQEVWVFDRTTSARKKLSSHASFKEPATWAPDSKRLAYTAANHLFVVNVETGATTERGAQPGRRLSAGGLLAGRQLAGLHAAGRRPELGRVSVRSRGEAGAQRHREPVHRLARRAHAGRDEARVPVGPRRRHSPPLRGASRAHDGGSRRSARQGAAEEGRGGDARSTRSARGCRARSGTA